MSAQCGILAGTFQGFAGHAAEVSVVFGNQNPAFPFNATLSKTMQGYWTSFARTGLCVREPLLSRVTTPVSPNACDRLVIAVGVCQGMWRQRGCRIGMRTTLS